MWPRRLIVRTYDYDAEARRERVKVASKRVKTVREADAWLAENMCPSLNEQETLQMRAALSKPDSEVWVAVDGDYVRVWVYQAAMLELD